MCLAFKKNEFLLLLTIIVTIVTLSFISCQKDLSSTGTDQPNIDINDLSIKISTNVDGFVTDENQIAVEGATVKAGSLTTTTDKFGYFKFTNVLLVKNAAFITVTRSGYFNGIKTFIATTDHAASFRIKLLPKTIAGSINSSSGGSVSLTEGLSVSLPANSVVNASSGVAYSGTIKVAMKWLSPVAEDLNQIMPGDLRGINTNGAIKLLTTYGMSAVELIGSAGERLQVAPGKKAVLNFPLPVNMVASAPANIPLWYFDEAVGLWKEEGSAVKTGNSYVGEVGHFSYWNCDMPADNYVNLSATVVNIKGEPMPYAYIVVHYGADTSAVSHGYTDASGYFSGPVPANSQLVFEIIADSYCGAPPYSQPITTSSSSMDLGSITINTTNSATITGTLINCNNQPVTDGYLIVSKSFSNFRVDLNSDGSFSYPITFCTNSPSISYIAVDNSTQKESIPQTHILTAGENKLGDLNSCVVSGLQFLNYNVNGVNYALKWPADSIIHGAWWPDGISIMANSAGYPRADSVIFAFTKNGIGLNSIQALTSFQTIKINEASALNMQNPINVNITEYGSVGEFIAGNFTGTFIGASPTNTVYNVTCTFRVRRTQ